MEPIKIRPGTLQDFALLAHWSADEFHWELVPEDFTTYSNSIDGEWFWTAENEQSEPVGFIAAVEHGKQDGYIGGFFVRKDKRSNGVGKVLFEKAMRALDGRNVGLAAEPHLVPLYLKKGFTTISDYSIIIADGFITTSLLEKKYKLDDIDLEPPTSNTIKMAVQYDSVVWGRNRGNRCVQTFLHHPHVRTLLAVDSTSKTVLGYGSVKLVNGDRLIIGPVVANTEQIAMMITFGLLEKYRKDFFKFKLRTFCFLKNDTSKNMIFEELGLEKTCEVKHMFRIRMETFDRERVFCLGDNDVNIG